MCLTLRHAAAALDAGVGQILDIGKLHANHMGASPDTHRILAVAPLIVDQRCYGEYPVSVR
jgi:hypothetical protein